MALKRTTKVEASFSMSSMTDIVFLLLIFFLVTSTLINPNALRLLLPRSSNQVSEKPMVAVSIFKGESGNYNYYLSDDLETPVPYDMLAEAIHERLGDGEDLTFSIQADETTPIGEVVAVMNIGKKLNYKVLLATRPE